MKCYKEYMALLGLIKNNLEHIYKCLKKLKKEIIGNLVSNVIYFTSKKKHKVQYFGTLKAGIYFKD